MNNDQYSNKYSITSEYPYKDKYKINETLYYHEKPKKFQKQKIKEIMNHPKKNEITRNLSNVDLAKNLDRCFNDQMNNVLNRSIQTSKKQGPISKLLNTIYLDVSFVEKSDIELQTFSYQEIKYTNHLIIRNKWGDNTRINFKTRTDYYLDDVAKKENSRRKTRINNEEEPFLNSKYIKIDLDTLRKMSSYN